MAKKIWPFEVLPVSRRTPLHVAQIEFLEHAHQKGFHPSMDGSDFLAENDEERSGWIIWRGNAWEIVLSQSDQQTASAFVKDFSIAGEAVLDWLGGHDVQLVIEGFQEHLVVPPGASTSLHINPSRNIPVKK